MNILQRTALFLFLSTLLLVGCSKGENNKQEENEVITSTLDVDSLLSNPDALVDQDVVLEGICTHICKHGGGKIFLMGSDDTKTIRVEAGDAIGSFPQECVHSVVKVEGKLIEERIDEAYLAQWEAEVAEATKQHGEGSGGCAADMQANAEQAANTIAERIANFRAHIAERTEQEGKAYVSLYHIVADKYEIVE
ncbi:hypothetical protein [Porphyromonas somerae]|uniref:hypothetical protein n=1 Tax=Porphyromonas somerae TaxID=322095 RepID=UPI001FCA9FF6|nr:hypothetical protein [Porphyromonas somerae]BDE82299.1 hypothetical protein CE91St14_13270 [Porphyromonas somerae]